VAAQHELVVGEGRDEEVDEELLGADGDGDIGAVPGRRDVLPIGDAHGEAGTQRGLEAEAACGFHGDEGVGGPRVHKSPDGHACDGGAMCMVSAVLMPVKAWMEITTLALEVGSSATASSSGASSSSSIR
jgi:hypothetical protein